MRTNIGNFFNFLRWIAAFMVVIGHLRSFLFVNYNNAIEYTALEKFFYFITGFGHQGVVIFFLVSGYLVGGGVIQRYIQRNINNTYLKLYFIKRFSRIYTVLVPALFFGFIFDSLGYKLFYEIYENNYNISTMNFNAHNNMNMFTFVLNFLNMQTIIVEPFGANAVLWSLSYEWWYYMLLPLFLISNTSRLISFGLILALLFLNYHLLIYASIWLLGALTFFINKRLVNGYVSIIMVLITLLISRKFSGMYIDFILSLSLALVVNSAQYSKYNFINILSKTNRSMANFSYSLYIFHFPLIVFIISFFHYFEINVLLQQLTLQTFILYNVILISIYMFAFAMYYLFEKHTGIVRDSLIKKFINEE
jgi:peptidoglycan/LPS O-acetylase OafA/YrhL